MYCRRRLGLLLVAILGSLSLSTVPVLVGQVADPKQPAETAKDGMPKKIPLDKFKMPAGGIVVLVDEAKDPRSFFPKMVILTPEKYQEMADRLALLEKLARAERKTPHACKLTAFIEGDSARVVAELALQTDQPQSDVLIGFKGSQLSEAKIRSRDEDEAWRPAMVDSVNDGYTVRVEKPGEYQMLVETRVPLAGAGRTPVPAVEHSFELGLPGAAVTTLALELPAPVKELRWNKTNIERPQPPATESKRWQLALGKITQLQLAWNEPASGGGANPLRTARGQVQVRFSENQVDITAELTLVDLNAKAKEWRLWLPAQAKVKVLAPEEPAHKLVLTGPNLHVLTLNSATGNPVKLQITMSVPRAAGKIPIGPFSVQDAVRQEGTFEIRLPLEARRSIRLTYHVVGSLEEREPPREQAGTEVVAVFKYWDMPLPPKNTGASAGAKYLIPPLEIEPRSIQGKMETHVDHQMRLVQAEQGWQVKAVCVINAKPLDAPVDFLDIQLPRIAAESWPLLPTPNSAGFPSTLPWGAWALASQHPQDSDWSVIQGAIPMELFFPDSQSRLQRKARLKMPQAQSKEFNVTLEGTYTLPAGSRKTRLELPRPVAIQDRGARGKVEVSESLELLIQEGGPDVPVPEKQKLTRNWERSPVYWEFGWREYRSDFPIAQVIDLNFRPTYVHARTQLTWDPADRPRGPSGKPALLRLDVPSTIKVLKIAGEGKIVAHDREKSIAWVDAADGASKGTVVLEYDFPLPRVHENDPAPALLTVPMAWPAQATHVDARVRVWSMPGLLPVLAVPSTDDLTWKDVGTEAVPGRDSLPVRVLRNETRYAPLVFRLERAPSNLAALVVDRALIQVGVDEDGLEQYRARFLLTDVQAPFVDIRMPLPFALTAARFAIDGKSVTPQPRDASGTIARIDLDVGQYGRPLLLEVDYQLPRDQPTREGFWHTTLNPPLLEGEVFIGKVRWQVGFVPTLLAVAARNDAINELQWRWRGWLPSLEPAASSMELEYWLTGREGPEAGPDASLLCARSSLAPLRILRVPRPTWYLICSGVVLALGFMLYLRTTSPLGWWIAALSILLALGATSVFWPEILPALLLGAFPGAVLLTVLVLLQWFVQERYRRQLVFMPGFTRVKAGSSLIRANNAQRSREPSTIDAPALAEKSNSGSKRLT